MRGGADSEGIYREKVKKGTGQMSIGDVVKLKMTTSRNTEFSQFKEAFNMGMTMTQKILAAHCRT